MEALAGSGAERVGVVGVLAYICGCRHDTAHACTLLAQLGAAPRVGHHQMEQIGLLVLLGWAHGTGACVGWPPTP